MALISVTGQKPDMAIQEAVQQGIRLAEAEFSPLRFEGEFPINGFGITEIRPYHVENTTLNIPQTAALNYWQTSQLTGSAWTTWINQVMDEDQYLVVTGIFNLESDPGVTELFVTANGVDLPIINIEQMYSLEEGRVWFTKPFIVKPKNTLKIQLYGKSGVASSSSQRIGLMGYTIAKRPRLISSS